MISHLLLRFQQHDSPASRRPAFCQSLPLRSTADVSQAVPDQYDFTASNMSYRSCIGHKGDSAKVTRHQHLQRCKVHVLRLRTRSSTCIADNKCSCTVAILLSLVSVPSQRISPLAETDVALLNVSNSILVLSVDPPNEGSQFSVQQLIQPCCCIGSIATRFLNGM